MSDHEKLREAIERAGVYVRCPQSALLEPGKLADAIALVIHAASAQLPKTKMASFWRVEYAFRSGTHWTPESEMCASEENAKARFMSLAPLPHISCIRITGPHQQEVPSE